MRGERHGKRQAHHEFATRVRAVTACLDRTAVHLDQLLHDRQANSQPALRASQVAIDLSEHLEDLRKHMRRDADSVVPHRHDGFGSFKLRG